MRGATDLFDAMRAARRSEDAVVPIAAAWRGDGDEWGMGCEQRQGGRQTDRQGEQAMGWNDGPGPLPLPPPLPPFPFASA